HHVGERLAVLGSNRELEVAQHPLDGARRQVAVAAVRAEERHLVLLPAPEEFGWREATALLREELRGPGMNARLPVDERPVAIEGDRAHRHRLAPRSPASTQTNLTPCSPGSGPPRPPTRCSGG